MPCIRHRSRASSTFFSGNWRAKFGRKLKNLLETGADGTDNVDEETPGARPSGVLVVFRLCAALTRKASGSQTASHPRFSRLTGVSPILWRFSDASRRFKFQKRSQFFVRAHKETLSVAMCVSNPVRSPAGNQRRSYASTAFCILSRAAASQP
jgi:hypothetical protein